MNPKDDQSSRHTSDHGSSAADFAAGTTASGNTNPSESGAPASAQQPTIANEGEAPPAHPAAQPARAFAPNPTQLIAGRFLVKRILGEGGMGRVYSVQDKQIEGRDVALKVLLPKYSKNEQFKKLFFQEVRAAQKFVSEYVCQVRDTGETEDGSLFLTMDLVEGESLRALLDREKVLSPRHALEITRQVLLGLQSGHEKGFVHRDIKPSNVMLKAGVPKTDTNPHGVGGRLLDFGIAGLAAEIGERSRAGTVMYMSPEQASGERLDPRSDLFAVGVLLFEMLSGRRPFEGNTTAALVQSVIQTNITERLNEIPNLQKATRRLLERALQKDRDKRFQSAGEFAEAIGKSASYKIPKEVPAWAYVAMGGLGLATGVLGFNAMGGQTRLDQLRAQITTLQDEVVEAKGEVSAARLDERRTADENLARAEELTRQAQEVARQAEEKRGEWESKFTAEKLEREASDRRYEIEMERRNNDDKWKEENTRRLNEQAAKIAELERTNEESKRRIDEYERELAKVNQLADPTTRMAVIFDAVLASVMSDNGANALGQFESAQRESTVFVDLELNGAAFLQSLAQASKELQVVRRADPAIPDIGAKNRAVEALRVCAIELATLSTEASSWIELQLGDAPPDRIARARQAFEKLDAEVRAVSEGLDQAHEAIWSAIGVEAALSDPQRVFEHATSFTCSKHLEQAAKHLIANLRTECVAEGELRFDALDRHNHLTRWLEKCREASVGLSAEELTELRMFEFARRWYDVDAESAVLDDSGLTLPPLAAANAWMHKLVMQSSLASPTSPLLGRPREFQLYRAFDSRSKSETWLKEALDPSAAPGSGEWRFLRETYQSNGDKDARPQALAFRRNGAQWIFGTSIVWLDFKSRDREVKVGAFPELPNNPPPIKTGVTDAAMNTFHKSLPKNAGLCLIVASNGVTRWISPRFGLVKEISQNGAVVKTLAFSSFR